MLSHRSKGIDDGEVFHRCTACPLVLLQAIMGLFFPVRRDALIVQKIGVFDGANASMRDPFGQQAAPWRGTQIEGTDLHEAGYLVALRVVPLR